MELHDSSVGYAISQYSTASMLMFRPARYEDLGVFDEPVDNGSGHRRIKEDVSPVPTSVCGYRC